MDKIRHIYEDNHVLVVVKPPNLPTQADDSRDPDLLSLLKAEIKLRDNKPGNVYLGLVQRLDRPVGGLMVFAKTSKAAGRLSEQMRVHDMGREYLAVLTGKLDTIAGTGDLSDYLRKDEHTGNVQACAADAPGAQAARLHYTRLASAGETALVAIRLQTGRKHQIRVQMAQLGCPLWGDHRYGPGTGHQQIALWGWRLSFTHPTTRAVMTFTALPEGGIWADYAAEIAALSTK